MTRRRCSTSKTCTSRFRPRAGRGRGGARRLLHARPRAARHRRRIRLRQVADRPRHPGPAAAARARSRPSSSTSTASICCVPASARCARIRGRRISMVLQDPKFSLNPGDDASAARSPRPIARISGVPTARGARRGRWTCWRRCASATRSASIDLYPHEVSGGMGQRVDDRHDADRRARPADRRRADLGARRDGADAGAGASSTSWSRERGMGLIFISHDLNLVALLLRPRARSCMPAASSRAAGRASCDSAQHPYTRGLLDCLPRIDRPREPICRCSRAIPPGRDGAVIGHDRRQRSRASIASAAARPRPRGARRHLQRRGRASPSAWSANPARGKSTVLRAHRGPAARTGAARSPSRGQAERGRSATRPSAGWCRWCSRTPMARCIRARPSTAPWPSRWPSMASATSSRRIAAALGEVGLGAELPLPLSAPALRRPAPARRHRPRPDPGAAHPAARRADLGARRLGAGGDPQPAEAAAARARPHLCSWSATISPSSPICATGCPSCAKASSSRS